MERLRGMRLVLDESLSTHLTGQVSCLVNQAVALK